MLKSLIPLLSVALMLIWAAGVNAQRPRPSPTPPPKETPEQLRIFTEEVRLPIAALDEFGHYDPTLELEDILVLEDGVAQQIKSVRHIPANVLLILDTGGDGNGLGGMSKKTSTTRDVAMGIVSRLSRGDRVAVLQSSNQSELVQNWTDDIEQVKRVLRWKLAANKRSRILESISKAAQILATQPEGSRHVVLITDGVETSGGKVHLDDAVRLLLEARATVHVISYTTLVRQKDDKQPSNVTVGQLPASNDPIVANDPTLPPGTTRTPSFGIGIRFDPAMRRARKVYEDETRKSEKWLTNLAEETGGRIYLPKATAEMIAEAEEVARQIGAEYVVTYRPTRPLAEAKRGEYRKIEVASRRVGLSLRSRRGYVVPNPQ